VRQAGEGRKEPDALGRTPAADDFEDALRRALHAAADRVEPAEDGLTRIVRRLAAPWLVRRVSLLVTDWKDLAWLITIQVEPAFTAATAGLAAVSSPASRARRWLMSQVAAVAATASPIVSARHTSARYRSRLRALWARRPSRPAIAWLQPALALAGVAIIVATGAVALRQAVARISLDTKTATSTSPSSGTGSTHGGHRQSPPGNLTQIGPTQVTHTRPGTTPTGAQPGTHRPSCPATRCPRGQAGTPEAAPSGSATPTPSQSTAPTPAPTRSHHHPPHPGHRGHRHTPGPTSSAHPRHKGHSGT
jgi:hypothetical protein